jgi:septal ring factor EnvC (AmiA/AmiB activator)
VIEMMHICRNYRTAKILVVVLLSVFLTGFASVGSLRALLKEKPDWPHVEVTMKKGDVLWNLAKEYYKDPLKWKIIAEKNGIVPPPAERRIPIGAVIYVPIEDAEKIAKETEKVVEAKKVAVDEAALKLAELQKELDRIKKEYEDCLARMKEMTDALKERDAVIAELESKIGELDKQLQAQSELEARLEDMRVAAKSGAAGKDELMNALKEKDASIAEKESRISEMEWKLKNNQADISRLEAANAELKARIEKAEKMEPEKPKFVSDPRARIAAMAIALVGSIIWMSSN